MTLYGLDAERVPIKIQLKNILARVGLAKAIQLFELSLMMQYRRYVSSGVAQAESAGALCNYKLSGCSNS
jgi:hypothetical protein